MRKLLSIFTLLFLFSVPAQAQDKPNIVLVFMDNFGWGEPGFNGGGIIRGAATPQLDKLAAEGPRLTNFNVEAQCTPSRSAIMTLLIRDISDVGTDDIGTGLDGAVLLECHTPLAVNAVVASDNLGRGGFVWRDPTLGPTKPYWPKWSSS